MVASFKTEDLYDFLLGTMTQPDPSTSVSPPLPKRHRWVPTTMVSNTRTQSYSLRPIGSRAQGIASEQGTPPYQFPNPRRLLYLLKWHPYMPMWVTPSRSTTARLRVPRGILPHHHMHPCVPSPFGQEAIMSLLPQYFFQCQYPQPTW